MIMMQAKYNWEAESVNAQIEISQLLLWTRNDKGPLPNNFTETDLTNII